MIACPSRSRLPSLLAASGLAVAGGVALVIRLRRRLVVVTVRGRSMEPAYKDGDRVLARRAVLRELRCGDVVVLTPLTLRQVAGPYVAAASATGPAVPLITGRWVIKRVAAVPGDIVPACVASARPDLGRLVPSGCIVVLGDNAAHSYDSRQEGFVRVTRVRAVALRHLD
jgi:signal peptidase I